MSDIASPTTAHADLRSASRSYNRDKNHTTKWSLGPRPNLNQPTLDSAWTANAPSTTNVKTVPEKWSGRYICTNISTHQNQNTNTSRTNGPSKSHANVSSKARGTSHYSIESANLRVTRKQDALREITSPDSKSLSRSLADLLPSTTTSIPIQKNEADVDVLYSFDKKASPSEKVGLGGLIERAEERWREKETVRLVRCEYEVLDGEGEGVVVGKRGRKGGDGGVGGGGVGKVVDDEDEYELV